MTEENVSKSPSVGVGSENTAVLHFTGQTGVTGNLSHYDQWYDAYSILLLSNIFLARFPYCRLVFDALGEDKRNKFFDKFNFVRILQTSTMVPIAFIALEPGNTNTQHFIFFLLWGENLLIINPLGITKHKDFYEEIKKIKRHYFLQQIYISETQMQCEQGLVSCGPICVELIQYITTTSIKSIEKSILENQGQQEENHELSFIPVNISNILPESLKVLVNSQDNEFIKRHFTEIRTSHLKLFKNPFRDNHEHSITEQNEKIDSLANQNETVLFNKYLLENMNMSDLGLQPEYESLKYSLDNILTGDLPITRVHQSAKSKMNPTKNRLTEMTDEKNQIHAGFPNLYLYQDGKLRDKETGSFLTLNLKKFKSKELILNQITSLIEAAAHGAGASSSSAPAILTAEQILKNLESSGYGSGQFKINEKDETQVNNLPKGEQKQDNRDINPSVPGKNLLLSRGFAGSIYQVKVLMLLAFNAFCKPRCFHLYTEAEGFGKFDDCVLFLEDRMRVVQVKHSFDAEGRYLLKHLTGSNGEEKGKKATLSKYFDSWLIIETLRQMYPEKYRGVIKYQFLTNHALSVEDGLSELYNDRTGKFAKELLNGTLGDDKDNKQEKARREILSSIYKYIKEIQDQIKTAYTEVIALLTTLKNSSGKAKDAVYVKSQDCSNHVKILFSLLLKYNCITPDEIKGTFNKGCFYKFTDNFLDNKKARELPSVIFQLRELLFKKDEFKKRKQRTNFYFVTIKSNFANLEEIKISSAVNAALRAGYLGPIGNDLLVCDVSDVERILANPVPQCVSDFFQQFQFRVKQPNEAELTKVLEEKIGEHFDSTDSGFYHYFYEEMLNFLLAASDTSITGGNLEALFHKAKCTLERNRLVGHSQRYEYHLRHGYEIKLDVDVRITHFTDFLESSQSFMVCYGHNDWLIAMTVLSELQKLRGPKFREDSYGFIDAKYAVLEVDEKVFEVEQFQLLVVDHAEWLTEKVLQTFIVQATNMKKKLILLAVNWELLAQNIQKVTIEKIEDATFYEIEQLSKEVVNKNIAEEMAAHKGVMVGNRFVSFEKMSSFDGYCEVMRDPFILSAMLKQARLSPEELESKPRLFVKPSLTYKNPIYRLEAIFGINYKVIHFDQADFVSLVQVLTLDLSMLSDEEKNFPLKKLIEVKKDKQHPEPEALCILDGASWNALSSELKQELEAYRKLIFIGGETPENLCFPLKLSHQFFDRESRYVLADAAMFKYMPETSEYVCEPDTLYDEKLVQRTTYPCRRVILSDYGSGKTYLTEELLRDKHSFFHWLVRIPAKTLCEEMNKWSLEQLAEYYLDITFLEEWQRRILQCDIESGDVFWILDGFDEMLTEQREVLSRLIQQIVNQPYCLVASRPSVAPFIPLQPNQFITLQPFDDEQIDQFVDGFFIEEEQKNKAKQLIGLWKNGNRLSLLGKPLMCRIACEIIDDETDTEELHDITLASLFDHFIQVNFRKYQCDHNRVPASRLTGKRLYHLSSAMVDRLKQVAYAKLFPHHIDVCLLPDGVLDADLLKLGLVTQITVIPATDATHYLFDHQTQLEYFAALYWVEKLLHVSASERTEYVQKEWANELYNVELRVVWQFVAGIVSTNHNIFLSGRGRDAFDTFCIFLLDSAEDLVGKVHQALLYSCYHNMQRPVLENSKYKVRFEKRISIERDKSESDDENKPIQVFRVPGRKRQNSEQIVEQHAYRKLHVIPKYYSVLPNDVEEKIQEFLQKDDKEVLVQLPLLKEYLSQPKINRSVVTQIRDRILSIYPNYTNNAEEYLQAYALLSFMLDRNLIVLQDCVEAFTRNFDQKNCVLDIVRRLNQTSLLTDEHLKVLFKIGRPRFWDYDVGLPAILLLKDRFEEAMAEMLRENIANRASGDWEIDRAINVLIEISKESYDFIRLSHLLRLIISVSSSGKTSIQQRKNLERTIFTSQDANLIIRFFSSYFESIQLNNIQYFYEALQLLYYFCCYYDLAVTVENNDLRILGRIQTSINLPRISVIKDFTFETLRALRDKRDSVDEGKENEKLHHIHNQLQVCQTYCDSLQNGKNWQIDLSNEENFEILKKLVSFLPQPIQIEQGLLDDFDQLGNKLPDKGSFYFKVAVLRIFGNSLSFVDEYLYVLYNNKRGEHSIFLDCDAGIPVAALLGNDFGNGAYEYLKYCYTSWPYCKEYVHDVLKKLVTNELYNPKAIQMILKTILIIDIFEYNTLNKFGEEIVARLELIDQPTLVQGFIGLLQNAELIGAERTKLKSLSDNWKDEIQSKLAEGIGQQKVSETRAGIFCETQKIFSVDDFPIVHDKKRRYTI